MSTELSHGTTDATVLDLGNGATNVADKFRELHAEFKFNRAAFTDDSLKDRVFQEFLPAFRPLIDEFGIKSDGPIDDSLASRMTRHVLSASSRRTLIRELMIATEEIFNPICDAFLARVLNDSQEQDKFLRLGKDMTALAERMGRDPSQLTASDPLTAAKLVTSTVLQFGISSLAHKVWSFLEVIPHINHAEGDIITPQEFRQIGLSVLPLTTEISRYHDFVFHSITSLLAVGENGDTPHERPAYDPEYFCISGDVLGFTARLHENARLLIEHTLEKGARPVDPIWRGCAATPLFKPVFNWCVKYAGQCLYPYSAHVASLGPE